MIHAGSKNDLYKLQQGYCTSQYLVHCPTATLNSVLSNTAGTQLSAFLMNVFLMIPT